MEYSEYKEKVIDATKDSEGLLYSLPIIWLHPEHLPLGVISLGNCTDCIIKIPNYSKEERVVQFSSGPCKLVGKPVSIITFTKQTFQGNNHITDVILQSNITKIPKGAFDGCVCLKRITIPKTVKYIGEKTFNECTALKDVFYEGSEEEWRHIDIVYKGTRIINPQKLGLYCDTETFPIVGNEALLNADIHFNCDFAVSKAGEFKITMGRKDITSVFTQKD